MSYLLLKPLIARLNHYEVPVLLKKVCKKARHNLPPNEIYPKFASPFKERYYYRLVR